jgi:hypothetical protein
VGPGRPICLIALEAQRGFGRHEGIAVLDIADTGSATIAGFQPGSTVTR